MTRFGLDYGGYLTPAQHKAVGSTFACRYLRELGAQEVRTLHAAGIDVVLISEHAATEALGGFAAGVARAKLDLAQANVLGSPNNVAIYAAVDFDETPAQAPTVREFFRGRNTIIPLARSGAYGGFWSIMRLFDAGVITYGWQTYGWSGGRFDQRCHLYQYLNNQRVGNVNVDYNHAFGPSFGQWAAAAPSPTHGWASVEASFEIQIDEHTGGWRAGPVTLKPQPLNALPLGS